MKLGSAMRWSQLAIALGLIRAAQPAAAQPARDSWTAADPDEADEAEEARSQLWESALDPQRVPYERLLAEANRQLERRTADSARLAIQALDEAVARIASQPRAYALRGEAYLVLGHWAACAADLERATATMPQAGPAEHLQREAADRGQRPKAGRARSDGSGQANPDNDPRIAARDRQLVELAVCQGRSGQLTQAERTLTQIVSRTARAEPWLRLGEVRIALGKLETASAALETALEQADAQRPVVEWLLAFAYDLAGRASDSADHASQALKYDPEFALLKTPQYPRLRAEDSDYVLALAYQASAMPEQALAHYRGFVDAAPRSPWHRRAEEHIRELSALEFPQTLERDRGSSATVEIEMLVPRIRKAMPALRACVVKQPTTVFSIALTRNGPRAPESLRDHPHYKMPAPGAHAVPDLETSPLPDDDATANASVVSAQAAACRCLERIAARIPLPAPTERDTWYRVSFAVVAPLSTPRGTQR